MRNQWKEDYYAVLGLDRNASQEDIKRAYRRLIAQCHPDKFTKSSKEAQNTANAMARLISTAYDTLNEKKGKKKDYDAWWDQMDLNRQTEAARKKAAEQEKERIYREAERKAAEVEVEMKRATEEAAKKAFEVENKKKRAEEEKARKKAERKAKGNIFSRIFKKHKTEEKTATETSVINNSDGKTITKFDDVFSKFQLNREKKGGTTDGPINKKAIASYIVAGALTIGLGVGIFTLIKNHQSSEKNTPPTEDQDNSTPNLDNTTSSELNSSSTIIYENWSQLTDSYDEETIKEVIKSINGENSSLTQDQTDDILLDVVNQAIVPSVNKAINGTDEKVSEINLSALIQEGTDGKDAVVDMENYLNGMITDTVNIKNYIRRAYEDQARLIGEEETVNGLNVTTEASSVSPTVRYIWSRLAVGVNAIAGTQEDEIIIEVNGNTYTQEDIDNSSALEDIAQKALKDMGQNEKRIELN